jgi:DNA adenine methylase
MSNGPSRPALRYLGGKWKLAPWIIEHFPPHDLYVEPFGGAASVLLRKPRQGAEVYNDLDGDVVNLFRVLRTAEQATQLADLVSLTPFAREEFESAYEHTDDPVERARRMLVRSFMGFGSCASRIDRTTGWRTGIRLKSASAARDWANYPDAIQALAERLRGVSIEQRPALDVLAAYDAETTLFYVDPPYVHSTRSPKRTRTAPSNGYAHELGDADHAALLDVLDGLKAAVVLSGYACELYDNRLKGWRRVTLETLADGARPRLEVLWLNAAAARPKGLFHAASPRLGHIEVRP